MLDKANRESEETHDLLDNLLKWTKSQTGRLNVVYQDIDLDDVVPGVVDIFKMIAEMKKIPLQYIPAEEKLTVRADNDMIKTVIRNFLSNAIKFTPNGGTISFRVVEKPVQLAGHTEFEFHIKDTGIGMSKEFQKTIFEACTREKTSTISGIQGTGLGMAITKSIVCRLSGNPTKYEEIPELQGLRALVADDDTDTCLSVCAMLRKIGMRPDWTSSGHEAVIRTKEALDQADEFRTYIIDWQMPDMNGVETVRRIRKVIGDGTPIIILTAYDWADIEKEAREAGVTAFCSKPLFLSELRDVLVKPLQAREEKGTSKTAVDFTGKKILLAEDNEMNQMIAEAILTEAGFSLNIACDGNIAVQMMKDAPAGTYDIILMDIQMPTMDGYEAARLIRALDDKAKAEIPIIAVTANAFEEDRKLALESGMNGHLAKPYDIPKMMETLAELLN